MSPIPEYRTRSAPYSGIRSKLWVVGFFVTTNRQQYQIIIMNTTGNDMLPLCPLSRPCKMALHQKG
jgi:hypothetical protein